MEVGNQEFHSIIFNAVKRDVRSAILELIRRERECEIIDRKLVKQVVEIFVEMGGSRNSLEVYVSDFEDMLLSTTADFYSRESAKWAEEDSFPDYMCKAEDRLQQEQQRVANYLHSSTEEKLLKARTRTLEDIVWAKQECVDDHVRVNAHHETLRARTVTREESFPRTI